MAESVLSTECIVSNSPYNSSCETNNLDCSAPDNDYLVRVRAQVMTRDDSSGGWLPTHGGGMSVVGLRAVPPDANPQYLIQGRRLCDQAVVLNCAVTDDLLYVKATPTFHHWRTCGKRFGLTFHSSADAQVFETCVQQAAHQLHDRPSDDKQDELCEADDEVAVLKLQPPLDTKEVSSLPASRTRTPSPTATMRISCMPSSAQRSSRSFAPSATYHPFSCPHLDFAIERSFYRRCAIGVDKLNHGGGLKGSRVLEDDLPSQGLDHTPSSSEDILDDGPSSQAGRIDGYVRFSRTDISAASSASGPLNSRTSVDPLRKLSSPAVDSVAMPHEYEYPALTSTAGRHSSLPPTMQQVSLPRRKQKKPAPRRTKKAPASSARARCIYCQELFFIAENRCGVCPDAPDDCAACIERTTCLCAARALLYHCATDDDGDYGPVCGVSEPSSPGSGSSSERRRRRKWILLALLSIVLPCLWCYPALAACHRCNVRRGHCGARHRAA